MWQILFLSLFVTCWCVPPTPLIGNYNAQAPAAAMLSGTEWYTLNGKTADPCATREQLGALRHHCVGETWPDSAVTVLLPVQRELLPNVGLVIAGKNIPSTTPALFLSASPGGTCDQIDTGSRLEVTTSGCGTTPNPPGVPTGAANLCTGVSFQASQSNWLNSDREFESHPRALCYSFSGQPGDAVYTGFKIGVVWSCNDAVDATRCSQLPINSPFLTPEEIQMRRARTTCCRHTVFGTSNVQLSIGQCINPRHQVCCQGAAIDPTTTRCCNNAYELTQWHTRPCPCRTPTPDPITCPAGDTCCEFTKYPELSSLPTATWPQMMGECFDATKHRCCDTGHRYDPGRHQCCNITGVQSLNTPCPCNYDGDCQGGQTTPGQGNLFGRTNGMICCKQNMPPPFESDYFYPGNEVVVGVGKSYPRCSKYANYPAGTGDYNSQRCLGVCMDNRFQICCNGVLCRKEYEKCCNSTCCNKFVGTCTDSFRPATPGNKHNYVELRIRYEVCTHIEQLDPIRAWWIFVLPTFLLFATVVGIAITIAVINRSTRRNYSFIERAMMTVAFLTMMFAFPCYFAPVYKYGVWVIFVSIVAVLTAAARLRWLNILCVVLLVVTLLYLFDPFHGNEYFNFSSLRVKPGGKHEESFADPESAGLLPSVHKMFRSLESVNSEGYCTKWYDYFMLDPQMHDKDRWNNRDVPTFGYCTRGWVTALLVFEGFVLMLTMFQFVLAMVALILRYREERTSEPIELEVRGADEVAPMPYY